MNKPPSKKASLKNVSQHLRPSDLVGVAKLVTSATLGITGITEGAHQAVWGTLGIPGGKEKGQTRGITGMVFKSIRGITQLVGQSLDVGLGLLTPLLDPSKDHPTTLEREAVLAALNGVLGDQMEATGNPLTTVMKFRHGGKVIDINNPGAVIDAAGEVPISIKAGTGNKILLMIHGSCMNDLQWHSEKDGRVVDHGLELAKAFGYTPLYLRYNTGRHISTNGRELDLQLEQLLAHWPQPVDELTILAHSMGGLVTRSACFYATQAGHRWVGRLKNIMFLGTPHWGSPLERAGNWVDVILASTPYTAPYAKLGHMRSAGVTDLRHGYLLDDDWYGHDRFHRKADARPPLSLPAGVACYTVAATLAAKRSPVADRLVGDGLVPLNSALGKHDDAQRSVIFDTNSQAIFYGMNHMHLLERSEVTQQLRVWLAGAAPDAMAGV